MPERMPEPRSCLQPDSIGPAPLRTTVKLVYDLAFIGAFGLAAFLVAWVVNGLVGAMSGENPRDTGRLGTEAFLRLFAILELGVIGRALNYFGLTGWPRKLVLFVGLLCLLAFLVRACQSAHAHDRWYHTYGVTNGQLYEIKDP